MDITAIVGPIIGASAALAGVGIVELIRRRNRAEAYATAIFARRLEADEMLFAAMRTAGTVASAAFDAPADDREDAKTLVFEAGLTVANVADKYTLYIEELGIHCTAIWLDVPDILDVTDAMEREERITAFRQEYRQALDMIRDGSGMSLINSVYHSVTEFQLESPIVDYMRELRKRDGRP